MVLRKPYAFLIRHFKLIHIILTVIMYLFFSRMRSLTNFLKDYVDKGIFNQISGVVSKYIGLLGFVLPIIIIAFCIIITYILKMKEKPIKFYLFTILAYIIEIIVMIVGFTVLTTIQQGTVNITFVEIFTDFIDAISYLTIPFMIISLVRGVGFNIKQFNFKKDLMELNIVDEDSEEFELEVDVDTEDLKAKFNRKLRFIKYIYLENKLVFIIAAILLVLGIVFGIYNYIDSQEKIYKEGYSFNAYGMTVTVKNSYKTKYGCDGNSIRKGYFYVIVELNVKNNYDQVLALPYEHIYLRVEEQKKYAPSDKYIDEFSDFGIRYKSNDKLTNNEERQVILVYEVDNEYIDNSLRFEYILSKVNEDKTSGSYKYAKIDLNPKEFNEVKLVDEKKLTETLSFKDSLIEGTKLKIEEVDFNNKYSYTYTQIIGSQQREFSKTIVPSDTSSYKKTIMRLKTEITKNNELNQKIYNSLYEKFATIEYEINGNKITQKPQIIDLTPDNNEYTYLEVVKDIAAADKVTLIFTIRDKQYRYVIVDKTIETENEKG